MLALCFNINRYLCGDDVLDVTRGFEGSHLHIVIIHQQLVDEVVAKKLVVLHTLKVARQHSRAEYRIHSNADTALALAAVANDEKGSLRPCGRYKAVAEILLQR